jgi:hypothetical protein
MSDEPQEPQEPRIFTLTEAERTRREIEPLLIEAMDARRKLAEAESQLSQLSSRIMLMGGMLVNYEHASGLRNESERTSTAIREALESIEATGCVVKDLDSGLLDFPARIAGEDVYLCWRLGEDRIRFYHRQDEGFSGRKPLDPRDTSPNEPIH